MLMTSNHVTAQKFGYINSAEILASMPEVKQAEVDIQNFSNQLKKKGEAQVAAFQKKVAAAQQAAAGGTWSPIKQKEEEAKLAAERDAIIKSEQEMYKQIEDKRSRALQPIYDKLNAAIEAVAKENGYSMIFDKGVLLYTDGSTDVSALVKNKMGI